MSTSNFQLRHDGLGLRDEEIICSSVPPYCIPLGNKVYEWLVNEFQNSDLSVIQWMIILLV